MAGLYLHIPFCQNKCPYCDFYSFVASPDERLAYPGLLKQHMSYVAGQNPAEHIESIYFGGGTPSLLEPAAIGELLGQIDQSFDVAGDVEITFEANPGMVTRKRLADYRATGVNRLSLGLQSCDDQQLAKLGRLHDQRDNLICVDHARQAGFDNISLDLMFALPGQSLAELEEELARYLELTPEHMSCYGLTAEPGTKLFERIQSNELTLPGEDLYVDAYRMIHERLTTAGYEHYEIANYAHQDYRCRHNEAYWQRKPCLGIGAGAHSLVNCNRGSRWQVPNDLDLYRRKLQDNHDPAIRLESFDRESALRESVYLALRTRRGVIDEELRNNFDCSLEQAFPEAVKACASWLENRDGRWRFSLDGWLLYDHLIQHFL